jgi:hypothetical protein
VVAEHTGDSDPKDAALQLKDGEVVGFHCFHAHCAKRTLRDMLKWFIATTKGTQRYDVNAKTRQKIR